MNFRKHKTLIAASAAALIAYGAAEAAGAPSLTYIAVSMIQGLAASATTDTTNASNISTGTLASGRLAVATASAPGAVATGTPVTNGFISSFASGIAQYTTVAFSAITGTLSGAQIPPPVLGSFTCDGSTTAYTLSSAPQSATKLIVVIGGVYQNAGSFSTSSTTLTLAAACPSGTAIEARLNP